MMPGQLSQMLPQPQMPGQGGMGQPGMQGGPVPPPTMGQPPASPDSMKIILAMMGQLSPDEQKGAVYGMGMNELLKKMDLKRKQREGADGIPGGSPMQAALGASSPSGGLSSMAAPLAGGGRF